jgi:hypothetical protein
MDGPVGRQSSGGVGYISGEQTTAPLSASEFWANVIGSGAIPVKSTTSKSNRNSFFMRGDRDDSNMLKFTFLESAHNVCNMVIAKEVVKIQKVDPSRQNCKWKQTKPEEDLGVEYSTVGQHQDISAVA